MKLSIPVPYGWRDTTWHNDQMPSIEPIGTDSIRVWVDDAQCSYQEAMGIDGSYRFILSQRLDDGQFHDVFESDNLQSVLHRF